MESLALAWLGCHYRELGQLEQALKYFQKRYAVALPLGDWAAQKDSLAALIDLSTRLNLSERTIQYYKAQASLFKTLKDYGNEYTSLYNLALLQFNRQQYQEALIRFERALQPARLLEGDSLQAEKIANARYMLGQCYHRLGQKEAAISCYEQAVNTYLELAITNWAEQGLEYLASLYRETQELDKEIECQKQRLKLVQAREDRITEQTLLYLIGNLYNNRKQHQPALEYYQQTATLARFCC
ncbi:MAG: tetratricopeptide repeat protein [Desertifilum sp. SIO1I2]|nr:tetratricopeptide repeat protein [Desertifilum sp. SIO1I2]